MATNDGTSLYYPTYFCGASSGTKYFYNYKSARPSWLCTLIGFCVPRFIEDAVQEHRKHIALVSVLLAVLL